MIEVVSKVSPAWARAERSNTLERAIHIAARHEQAVISYEVHPAGTDNQLRFHGLKSKFADSKHDPSKIASRDALAG